MEILGETIDRELPDLAQQGVRTRFFGRRDRVPGICARARWGSSSARPADLDTLEPLDRVRLRRPGGDRRGGAPLRRGRPRAGRASTRPRSRRGSTRPSCPRSTSSSAPPASSGSRTSCSGRRPTPSSSSPTRSGPTSARTTSAPRSRVRAARAAVRRAGERLLVADRGRARPAAARPRDRLARRLVALRASRSSAA